MALGFTGTTTDEPRRQVIATTGDHFGPPGELKLYPTLETFTYRSNSGSSNFAEDRYSPQCSDGVDNDADGLVDSRDPGCSGDVDDNEAVIEQQLPPPAFVGTIDDRGTAVLPNLSFLPPRTWKRFVFVPSMGTSERVTLTATFTAGPSFGSINPATGIATVNAPLHVSITCTDDNLNLPGSNECFTGTCSPTVDPKGAGPGLPVVFTTTPVHRYSGFDGTAQVEGRFDLLALQPGLTQCTSDTAANVALANAVLGLPSTGADNTPPSAIGGALMVLGFEIAEASYREMGPYLSIAKETGHILYDDHRALLDRDRAPSLPDDDTATAAAVAFLQTQGLMPPDATTEVQTKYGLDRHNNMVALGKQVTLTPALAADGTGCHALPVDSAEVEVLVGESSRIIGIESHWRPVTAHGAPVPVRILAEAKQDVVSHERTAAEVDQMRTELVYSGIPLGGETEYVAPMYLFFLPAPEGAGQGSLFGEWAMDAVPASHFLPYVALLSPDTGHEVDGATGVTFAAENAAGFGTPPLTYEWRSSEGRLLGTGATLTAPLGNGVHGVELRVSDANGAGYTSAFTVSVTNSPAPAPPPQAQDPAALPLDEYQNFAFSSGKAGEGKTFGEIQFSAKRRDALQKQFAEGDDRNYRGSPSLRFLSNNRTRDVAVEEFKLHHFRYEIVVSRQGTDWAMRSSPCIDGVLGGSQNACLFPRDQFARVSSVSAPKTSADGANGQPRITGQVVIDNLPGQLTLDFEYQPWRTLGGSTNENRVDPEEHWFKRWALNISRPLGGMVWGYKPKMTWFILTPASINACDVKVFCSQTQRTDTFEKHIVTGPGAGSFLENLGICDPALISGAEADCPPDVIYDRAPRYPYKEFRLWTYHAIAPMGKGVKNYTTFVRDQKGGLTGLLEKTEGELWEMEPVSTLTAGSRSPIRPPGHMGLEIAPIETERVRQFMDPLAKGDATRGAFDNIHVKGKWPDPAIPVKVARKYVDTFKQCFGTEPSRVQEFNKPSFYRRHVNFPRSNSAWDVTDTQPSFHFHEFWYDEARTQSENQFVFVISTRDYSYYRSENALAHPWWLAKDEETLYTSDAHRADGLQVGLVCPNQNVIRKDEMTTETAQDAMVWHESYGVQGNQLAPVLCAPECKVFDSPFFFSH